MNLAVLAEEAFERLGERMTLDFEGVQVTNAESMDQSRRLQRAFEGMGMKRGEIAVLCMINHPLIYPVFGGIFRTGATAVPVMFMLQAPELRFVIQDTRASWVFTDPMNLPKVHEAIKGLDHVKKIVVLQGKDNPEANPPEFSLENLLKNDPQETIPNIDADEDVALMLYTSGTTGKPKGVMLTHSNLLAQAHASNDASEFHLWDEPRIALSPMPMAHIYGVGVMTGGYLTPKELADGYLVQMQWFEPNKLMQLADKHRCNMLASVPTMLTMILNHPKVDDYDLTCFKEAVCGAAPLPVEVAEAFMKKFDCRVREIYGMTENAGIATANRLSDPYRPGSAGKPYCNVEIKIFDDDDNEVPVGERGEVVTRGATTMKGYHNRPEATEETMRGGWLHTGDIGYMDEEGWLFIVDRKKDMIIKGGENIYPAELEDVLYTHPQVAEAAIVGVPHPTYGESVSAFVVPVKDAELTEQDIIGFMANEVTKFKLPSRVHFKEALPKVGIGKILRRELREEALKLEQEGAASTT